MAETVPTSAELISRSDEVLGGTPVFRGTRVPCARSSTIWQPGRVWTNSSKTSRPFLASMRSVSSSSPPRSSSTEACASFWTSAFRADSRAPSALTTR